MQIGEIIPDTLGIDADGRLVTANGDYPHTPLIVYFYPKDNTPGCTAEACSIRDGYAELRRRGYAVIGISRDTPESHKRFAAKHELPFTLLTDVTFITDADHVITHIIGKVNTKNAASQILDLLDGK